MKNIISTIAFYALCLSMPGAAHADEFDRSGIRGDTYCFPAKFAVKIIENLGEVGADKRDVVDIKIDPQFLIYDGGALPERFFLKTNDGSNPGSETPLTINPDGSVPDFLDIATGADNSDDICITDPARAGLDADDESLYFEMGLTPYFVNRSGTHTLQELSEGASDGKSLYKLMIPAVARLFMPDTDHMSVRYDNPKTNPQITAMKDGKPAGDIPTDFYNEAYVFDYGEVEGLGADSIKIGGGPYRLAPVPSIKTMKRFGIGKPRGPKAN